MCAGPVQSSITEAAFVASVGEKYGEKECAWPFQKIIRTTHWLREAN